MKTESHLVTCLTSGPRMNLGSRWTSTNAEDLFADAFCKVYSEKHSSIHYGTLKNHRILAREVPVTGLGIADMVAVSWRSPRNICQAEIDSANFHPTIRAFEFKLHDWRRGIMQAARYRYFADASILVIPSNKLHLAESSYNMFETLNIGLWGFNENSKTISMLLTPRPCIPEKKEHRERTLDRVLITAKQALQSL